MLKKDGNRYNPTYINRVGRELKAAGYIERKRVEPGTRPPCKEAKHTSAHGTTFNRVLFGVTGIGRTDPLNRHEASLRPEPERSSSVTPPRDSPRNAAIVVPAPVNLPKYDPLAIEIERFKRVSADRDRRQCESEDLAMMDGVVRAMKEPKPPS
jgi:hypothetical protein